MSRKVTARNRPRRPRSEKQQQQQPATISAPEPGEFFALPVAKRLEVMAPMDLHVLIEYIETLDQYRQANGDKILLYYQRYPHVLSANHDEANNTEDLDQELVRLLESIRQTPTASKNACFSGCQVDRLIEMIDQKFQERSAVEPEASEQLLPPPPPPTLAPSPEQREAPPRVVPTGHVNLNGHQLPLPERFINELPTEQRLQLVSGLPDAVRHQYLNMCWREMLFSHVVADKNLDN